mmetsp:Transcript_3866/g.5577  ORF Transcript_3866/g.5577 Transcript_3866/m.5577 type:complete len:146 (-) Transcript_3866:256-693(-)
MKLLTTTTIISVLFLIADVSSAHSIHDEDITLPSQTKHGWFGGRRSSESLDSSGDGDGDDVLKTSAMHSFTGIEGLDHEADLHPAVHKKTDDDKKTKKSKPDVKDIKTVKEVHKEEQKEYAFENDLQRYTSHSFAPHFPMYPFLL